MTDIVRSEVTETRFGFYSDAEIRNLSVVRITSGVTEDALGHLMPGSLYDPRMGPMTQRSPHCETCGLAYSNCPGHCGHVELCVNVYQPLMFGSLFDVLKSKCLYCHRLRLNEFDARVTLTRLLLLDMGKTEEATMLGAKIMPSKKDDPDGEKKKDFMDLLVDLERRAFAYIKAGGRASTDLHIRAEQRRIISDFRMNSMHIPSCRNCDAPSNKIRKDGCTKFFVKPLTKQQINAMAKLREKGKRLKLTTALTMFAFESTYDLDDDANIVALHEEDGVQEISIAGDSEKYLAQNEVVAQIRLMWMRDRGLLDYIWGRVSRGTDLQQTYFYRKRLASEGKRLPCPDTWRIFFMKNVLVPPSRFRPYAITGDLRAQHPQNELLKEVLELNEKIANLNASMLQGNDGDNDGELDEAAAAEARMAKFGTSITTWIELQNAVNVYMDSNKNSDKLGANRGPPGIRQLLERKEGLFRKNMMGKRVNYCCRSVISPDPYLGTDEVGLPLKFAKSLQYPMSVTHWNFAHARKLVENGPNVYPGANQIETAEGKLINLARLSATERAAKAKLLISNPGSKVHRHLVNGDVLLVNRQPTLHKPGIMAHKARILTHKKESTVRMHYANCNAYNADFDGDEINCHFVQDEISRAEANIIANTDNQYIVPTNASPLRGLIQDHVASGVKMCTRDTFLTRAEAQQLLYVAVCGLPGNEIVPDNERLVLPQPAILRPRELWTGKQVVSALIRALCKDELPCINLDGKTRTPATAFGEMQMEHKVIFRDSELLCGVLDKAAMGASSLGIVHALYELYGADKAGKLLSAFCRLFTNYLQQAGHTCGVEDLTLTAKADENRRKMLLDLTREGVKGLYDFVDEKDDHAAQKEVAKMLIKGGRDAKVKLDGAMQGVINKEASGILKACFPDGLERPFPLNNFSVMVLTGAKGSGVNQSQISCFLGQQALEGQRVPIMISGKSLPSFPAYDTNPRAGGFVADRFLTGVRPQEYYFHCMAGREGLVDTAVKTSRSGYLQRCLVKHLEELRAHYDYTVRDSGNNVVQFLYGEDGLDPVSASIMGGSSAQFDFMAKNTAALKYTYRNSCSHAGVTLDTTSAETYFRRLARAYQAKASPAASQHSQAFETGHVVQVRRKTLPMGDWEASNLSHSWHSAEVRSVREKGSGRFMYELEFEDGTVEKKVPRTVEMTYTVVENNADSGEDETTKKVCTVEVIRAGALDPAMSVLPLSDTLGAMSEKLRSSLDAFLLSDEGKRSACSSTQQSTLREMVHHKYMRALVAPGEAVGCIAAQSIGEPSTQMTLNTFHLAGHGGANVTLGIPRLREIIMTASKELKTPTMTIPLLPTSRETPLGLARKLARVSLHDVLHHKHGIRVKERVIHTMTEGWQRQYDITFQTEDPRAIKRTFHVSFKEIVSIVRHRIPELVKRKAKGVDRQAKARQSSDHDPLGKFRGARGGDGAEGGGGGGGGGGSSGSNHAGDGDDDGESVRTGGRKVATNKQDVLDDLMDGEMDEDEEAHAEMAKDAEEMGGGAKLDARNNAESYDDDADDGAATDGDASDSDSSSSGSSSSGSDSDSDSSVSSQSRADKNREANPDAWSEFGTIDKKKGTVELSLRFPASSPQYLMLEMVTEAAVQCPIRETAGIVAAHAVETPVEGKDVPAVLCEGINFGELWQLSSDICDHSKIKSNDIYHTLLAYGVEAARSSIMNEIKGVFGVYGINVDPRHLSLVADFMTRSGSYVPMNRAGMHLSSSPFLQMSFETTTEFMTAAVCEGTVDRMDSSSARLVLGSVPKVGTGCFDVMLPLIPED